MGGIASMIYRMMRGLVGASFAASGLAFSLLFLPTGATGQSRQPGVKIDRRTITPDLSAPELYSEQVSLKISLVNLPGADMSGSYWQEEFKVFFVAEQDFQRIMKELQKDGRNRELKPEYFPNRIMIAEGSFTKNKLGTLDERTFLREGIPFRRKIPAPQRTSFSSLLTFFSVKVHDAKLKRDAYRSDVFIVPPFDTDSNETGTFSPRSSLYLSLYVDERGSLFWSNRKKAGESTVWNPN
jgi:hypothetical protein